MITDKLQVLGVGSGMVCSGACASCVDAVRADCSAISWPGRPKRACATVSMSRAFGVAMEAYVPMVSKPGSCSGHALGVASVLLEPPSGKGIVTKLIARREGKTIEERDDGIAGAVHRVEEEGE